MIKRRISFALASVHVGIGAVPLFWAVRITTAASRGNDASMAWGVANAMFVSPIWALFLIVALVVDRRAPRTTAGSLAALSFPVGFVLGAIVLR